MQQPPYEQWQQPYYQPPQPVYMQVQQHPPAAKPKNETMKTFSILAFIAFVVLVGTSVLTTADLQAPLVGGLLGCGGFLMFAAGFLFLCLI